ncbi:hypothetical protein NE619_02155 [Anaerovorax odorimutans]|uniref:Adhesin domain-containing protein n=1 Tax=Anaerovorax odorimutans TaxID=109327 RepID=A0ABT1RK09_9FIRM|nr:hypothetical protein [Anaerovorax odorimutans]MCQ4635519.1 hypothetical protein [Anaerovorax odorimutans]
MLYNEASAKNLNINNARICAARFTASGNFELAGSAVVSVKKMDDADEKSLAARVQASGNININMETGGRLEIEAADGVLPLSARGRIILGEKNKILVPENGEILNAEDSLGDSIICDSQGNDAANVIIEKR